MATNECISKVQFEYVCRRINDICRAALAAKKEELTITYEHKITDEEAESIFISVLSNHGCREFKVKDAHYLHNALDFSPFESEFKYDEAEYKKFSDTITAEAINFKDRVVLCSAENVLAELQAFEKKYLGDEKIEY